MACHWRVALRGRSAHLRYERGTHLITWPQLTFMTSQTRAATHGISRPFRRKQWRKRRCIRRARFAIDKKWRKEARRWTRSDAIARARPSANYSRSGQPFAPQKRERWVRADVTRTDVQPAWLRLWVMSQWRPALGDLFVMSPGQLLGYYENIYNFSFHF